ncbi:MAG: hypothetical protein UX08_C0002G0009 [Candidatus Collierbacteria bacterium GW2011_GWB1_45_35]|uniref:HEAT repeat domain-containing protein n=2 Tax=Candidatus Collieribacteriota TaxID=1752725 RepID=A0A0G1KR68_9BACT|nr:MAG: hypothetical protein UW48_C0004G0019 [Microgenomates group bacterium GW2011_GWC1_44_23]KKT85990.1 MAG: hypothetical protein UW84_C0018G0014 [Candidatus Collierbacteria bacterium GW2011_GWA2_44_99]KKT95695.1 MAG: hypothetical protein UW96_C0005G0019 [Candidatus Collierbacteria bacterium GW2011_GWA1_45_15]KKU00342.1 MAG: hypothetical protein UX01_C0005G0019 [Candidatus Collierbacteria bacterium GW2011_GWB2_45_17]KKU05794.1 MAG: hypothetical protein UX08_C0002G0009 [Candidatus Collierbacte
MNIDELIIKLSIGDKQEIKEAICYIEKLPKISKERVPSEYKELLFWAFRNYSCVKSSVHKVAILKGLKSPFMYLGARYYEECSEFLLQTIQSSDGNIREQTYHAVNWFLTDITPNELSRRKKDYERQKGWLVDFVIRLNQVAKEHKVEAKGLLYLNEMRPCPYKSIQKILRRILTSEWYLEIIHLAGYVEHPHTLRFLKMKDMIFGKLLRFNSNFTKRNSPWR